MTKKRKDGRLWTVRDISHLVDENEEKLNSKFNSSFLIDSGVCKKKASRHVFFEEFKVESWNDTDRESNFPI